jgi:hypothetical protein
MWLTPFTLAVLQIGTVQGTVREDSTLIPLPSVEVGIEAAQRSSVTDGRGNFVLQGVPAGRWTVVTSAIGYDADSIEVVVEDGRATALDIRLRPSAVLLSGINVDVVRLPTAGPVPVRMDMPTLVNVPALAEVDVLRALDVLPSVAATSEYSTALYVRGSTPDQTDILLDGFPVFNPYHLGGLHAAFNPDAVSAIEVVSGAMPARLGSRISSAVTVETREGGSDRLRGRGTLSLSSIDAAVDGPVPVLPGTFLASARQSLRNATGGGITGEGTIPRSLDVGFRDLLAKWTVPWSNGTVEALHFSTSEHVTLPERGQGVPGSPALRHDWRWGSRLWGISTDLPLASAMRLEARVGWASFDTDLDTWWQVLGRRSETTAEARASMEDGIASASVVTFGSLAGTLHQLVVGGELRRSRMAYRSFVANDAPRGVWNEFVPLFDDTFELDLAQFWVEDEITLAGGFLGVRLGVRGTVAEDLGTELQPRAGVRVAPTDWFALTAGAGRYAQAVHSARIEESVAASYMAFDLLRPARASAGMPTAEDVVVGAELRRGPFSARVDAYAKRYARLALPALPFNPWAVAVVELDAFETGTATTRGVELLADYVRDPVSAWLSYAWQRTRRSVDGTSYTPRHERRHTVDLLTAFALGDGLQLNARAIYATGQPTTSVVGSFQPPRYAPERDAFDSGNQRRLLLGEHNGARLDPYMRLDIGGRLEVRREVFGRPTDLEFFVQLLNVLNMKNHLSWEPTLDPAADDDPARQLPLTLTAGVAWRL